VVLKKKEKKIFGAFLAKQTRLERTELALDYD
jgi:hypothetical protein